MLNILAMMLQTGPSQAAPPLYVDNTSIWRHMSDALHESLYRVLSLLIAILPGILALILALVVLTIVGMALSALLRRALTAARFDERIAHGRGSDDWAPSTSPTALIARAAFWGCVLLGLIIGVSAFDASYATSHNVYELTAALPYPCRRRRPVAHCRNALRAFPCAIGPYRSCECAA